MKSCGGLVPFGWLITQAPEFTLYGDGTVIFRPLLDPERPRDDNRGLPRFLTGRLDAEEVQALLAFALGPGRLLGARANYPQTTCADCGLTIFTLDAGGQDKVVTIHETGMTDTRGPDAADRRGFAQLAEVLRNFDQQQSGLNELVLYDAPFYRVGLLESFGAPAVDPLQWPWDDLSVDDFKSAEEFAPRLATLSREQVAEVMEVPSGGHPGIWILDPDDTAWTLTVRPLLPDEIADPPL